MTEYKDEDFKGMMFPFHKTDNPLTSFPKLKQYREFEPELNQLPEVIKYVAFCYDKASPLQNIENIVHRKVTAAQLAGFKNTDDDYVQQVMKCQIPEVNLMIVRYCRMMSSRLYMAIVAGNETINKTLLQLLDLEASTNKKHLLEDSELRLKLWSQVKDKSLEMDELSAKFLSDENTELNEVLYKISDMTEEEYINLTPEDFSKRDWQEDAPIIKADVR